MCVDGNLLVVLLLVVAPPLSVLVPVWSTPVLVVPRRAVGRDQQSAEEIAPLIGYAIGRRPDTAESGSEELLVFRVHDGDAAAATAEQDCGTPARPKRRTPFDGSGHIDASPTVWEWLKSHHDKPEDNCLLMAIGGVASGGALTGAFVGAGIGSIFTGPGAIVGGIVGGLVGVFGGLSVGTRAGAVACDSSV
ncbi:uncharacterized protein LOC128268158 isoform X2 [Anopheles cruzii]|uniref:uncharacterized protein LOC128268158 isoform X2 n=1 Tax=Anopheles cruzii TaxID=68878 RepID=UPI0022EC61DC|nr:uncharacterized protein LOC128268158 isoform X2 [Anopheles cruzii]